MHIKPAEIVFNEDSIDRDFRVESNGNANMLFVDGGNDRVGIGGTGNPTLYVVNNNAGPALTSANATAVFHGSVDAGKGGCIGFDFGASHTNYPVGMGYLITSQSGSTKGDLGFFTRNGTGDDAPTQRFRIQADGRLVQTSQGTTTGGVNLLGESGSSSKAVVFAHVGNGSEVGSITTASSSTAYNTSSDYRLKDNINYDWDGTAEIKKLKPAKFNFKIDADTTVHGFIAHEVSDIVPEAVTGTKDGVEVWEKGDDLPKDDKGKLTASVGDNKLDADGKTIPKYQGIDQSKLVPLLVKTIQELEARITTLENA
jgi:prepilin-type processing-associated H-X9-DG protein